LDATDKPRKRLRKLLRPLARDYDRVFLDCPPGLSLLSESVFVASHGLLVPTIPTTLSLRALDQIRRHLKKKGPGVRVWPFFCQVDRRKGLHREITSRPRIGGYAFLKSQIPYSTYVERMGIERAPVAHCAPASPPARAYVALHREMEALLRSPVA
jgi:cellulose biosynthesis protein BcsQ